MTNKTLAQKIAKHLFTNGMGEHAERLVLELKGKQNGGGWSEKAVVDAIKTLLDEATRNPSQRTK